MFQKSLQDAAESCGCDVNIRSYSGRAMYGKTCLGITGEFGEVIKTIGEACALIVRDLEFDDDETVATIDKIADVISDAWNFRQDSMGLGVVIYWPRILYDQVIADGVEPDDHGLTIET